MGIGLKKSYDSGSYSTYNLYYLTSTLSWYCYDSEGDTCYAVCTNAFTSSEIEIENSTVDTGYLTISCPDQYVVSGCGLNIDSTSTESSSSSSYMINNSTCACYSASSHFCQAICIPPKNNLANTYQIVSVESSGTFTVSCPTGLSVGGCGYSASSNSSVDVYWYVYPQETYCECRNQYGATCYANCFNITSTAFADCSNCLANHCASDGCMKCDDDYILDNGKCVEAPCPDLCPLCLTIEACSNCSTCTQSTSKEVM